MFGILNIRPFGNIKIFKIVGKFACVEAPFSNKVYNRHVFSSNKLWLYVMCVWTYKRMGLAPRLVAKRADIIHKDIIGIRGHYQTFPTVSTIGIQKMLNLWIEKHKNKSQQKPTSILLLLLSFLLIKFYLVMLLVMAWSQREVFLQLMAKANRILRKLKYHRWLYHRGNCKM